MTHMLVGLLLVGATWSLAQARPEEEWGGYPGTPAAEPATTLPTPSSGDPSPPPPPPDGLPPPPPLLVPLRAPKPVVRRPAPPPQVPNTVSMLGAPTLGSFERGEALLVGFPFISLRFSLGLGERVDLGVGFDSYYLAMNEPLLTTRVLLGRTQTWSFAAVVEAGYAFFGVRASRETRGARWLTGRRNINVAPSFIASYQGTRPRAARLFFAVRYLLSLDTEPVALDPLGGVPPALVAGHNFGLRGGAELPLSPKTSFVFTLGLDVHTRVDDAPVMPDVAVGVVTSF
jgi:hypothetical protein